jgi:multidrug efflux pump subunit AcrA (membrane-fusion protein)
MRRRNLIINGVLVVGVVVVGTAAYLSVGTDSKSAATTSRTTTVEQGTVVATVAGSGNVTSGVNESVSFSDCSGKLTSVLVSAGQHVTTGQKLASVDPTSAAQSLEAAQLNYNAAVASAQDAITQAQSSVSSAQTSYNDDVASAGQSVTSAQEAVDTDNTAISNDNATVAADQVALAKAQATKNQQKIQAAESALSQAESQLTKDQAQLTKDQPQLTSAQTQLTSTEAKDQSQIDSAQTSLEQAQAPTSQGNTSVATSAISLTNAKKTLSECTLTSPGPGTITAVNGTVGQTPSTSSSTSSSGSSGGSDSSGGSGNSTGTGTSTSSSSSSSSSGFITMVDMTKLEIDTDFSESDIASLQVGQPAAVVFSALPSATSSAGTTVNGKVTAIDVTSTVTSNVVDYGVTIALVYPPADLRLGQTGSVTVTTAQKTNVLYALTTAITTTGVGKTVMVKDGATTKQVTVTTGVAGNSTTEILTGVTAGQTLVIPTTTTTSTTFGGGGLTGVGGTGRR